MFYELYYWPGIPGRGEFVRLALEEAGVEYIDIAKDPAGEETAARKLHAFISDATNKRPPFAPPVLKARDLVIAQTANILMFLGSRHGLAPNDEAGRLWTHQLQLTLADWIVEIHDTHHPLGPTLYYEAQKAEANRRTAAFIEYRLPKFMGYFEKVMQRNPDGDQFAVGVSLTYVDLSLFQMIEGLRYAFPKAMSRIGSRYPRLVMLHDIVAERERIAAYLGSVRRLPFNEDGLFRYYPELDF